MIDKYQYFVIDMILESHHYEWDFEKGVEIDKIEKTVKKLDSELSKSSSKLKWFENFLIKLKKKKWKKKHLLMLISGVLTSLLLMMPTKSDDVKNIIDRQMGPSLSASLSSTVMKEFSRLKRGYDLKPSNTIREFIKNEEKLKLTAYTLGDGKITIGYGHAEPINRSKYKKGDKISKETANKLFEADLEVAYKGVQRIFKQWEKEGNDVLVSQEQFDAMVSLAFNMGVSGLRRTKFIKLIKKGDILGADKELEKTAISYPGHVKRRKAEGDIFFQDVPPRVKYYENFLA